ncbi:MAG TPA: hypothetical protein PKA16_06000 [Ottowia sp.]|uniref:hypothetical protein n=1 Tax=Ottowia sp. TaxID=1898956 RepID=UPI002BFF0BA7|nr:hypothetical protein [Ottowia sp.]HMN20928.1 hypothetical protein [Ottowia sp.]
MHIFDPRPSLCCGGASQGADCEASRYYDDNYLCEPVKRQLVPLYIAVLQPLPTSANPLVV